jgi:hypothetical protein
MAKWYKMHGMSINAAEEAILDRLAADYPEYPNSDHEASFINRALEECGWLESAAEYIGLQRGVNTLKRALADTGRGFYYLQERIR